MLGRLQSLQALLNKTYKTELRLRFAPWAKPSEIFHTYVVKSKLMMSEISYLLLWERKVIVLNP